MIPAEAWRGVKVAIIGAAREGTALARYLAACGAQVTLSDTKPAEDLGKALAALEGLPVRLALGGNPADLLTADVLFTSPGVPPTAPIVVQAREKGVPISSEPRLFIQSCEALVVGITGSSGKTTTTTLTGQMYAAAGRRTWVGGNVGQPLTERLLGAERPEVAVMELSSFQLELFAPEYQGTAVEARRSPASRLISVAGWSPQIAAITNITPNHLDRHPSMEDYIRAKTNILRFQRPEDAAVLNADDPVTASLVSQAKGHVFTFSLESPVAEGAYLCGEELMLRHQGRERRLGRVEEVKLRGRHNLANILAAACCALAGGVELAAMQQVASTFTGVAHRLETVGVRRGVTYVNDSIATSPERAMAALRAYREPLVLLAGGRDKHLPWDAWAELVHERVRVVVAFGEAVPIVVGALERAKSRGGAPGPAVHPVASLEEAVELAARLARPGEVVLLSPGGTSFDAFKDFEARGNRFRELVAALGK